MKHINTIFLQSETADPFGFYTRMRDKHPVYYDGKNKVWAVYGYRDCEFFLKNGVVEIPRKGMGREEEKLWNKYARDIREKLVRRSDPPEHGLRKAATKDLVKQMQPVNVTEVLDGLLKAADTGKLQWAETIAGILPLTVLLKSFRLRNDDIDFIISHMHVVKLYMTGTSGIEEVHRLNAFSEKVYPLIKNHFRSVYPGRVLGEVHVSNLMGLCIQSYDAMRGLLGNSLLQYLYRKNPAEEKQADYFRKLVVETLRFDPVFHNTRRILTEDVECGGCFLKKGDELLLVLASANRDASVFDNAATFDINRGNNGEYLSFSFGIHRCPADHFSVTLASETLHYMASRYHGIELLQPEITYEPLVNARIPHNINLKLTI